MRRFNPYEFHTPPGWRPISEAPRDGTVIEIQNNYGIAPWFGVYKWVTEDGDGTWQDARDPCGGLGSTDALHLSWRPYDGQVEAYSDPTGGEQQSSDYWIRAAGLNPWDYPDRPNPLRHYPRSMAASERWSARTDELDVALLLAGLVLAAILITAVIVSMT